MHVYLIHIQVDKSDNYVLPWKMFKIVIKETFQKHILNIMPCGYFIHVL